LADKGLLDPPPSASRGQLKKSAKVLGGINTHDQTLQLFALLLADDIAARGEFYRDLFLGHWVARITLGDIDTSRVRLIASL
jgi:hypothetical protein